MKLKIFIIALLIVLTGTAFADGLQITDIRNAGYKGIKVVWTDSGNNGLCQVLYLMAMMMLRPENISHWGVEGT